VVVELGLGDTDCLVEVVIVEGGVDDLVTMGGEVRRLYAAGDRMPAM